MRDETDSPPGLILAGIDEAGYGPRLGPLCVGLSVFRVEGWREGDHAPDLWRILRDVVCRGGRDARPGRIAIDDSKRLKRPNSTRGVSPIEHLERGVRCVLGCAGGEALTDLDLLRALGADLGSAEWYAGAPGALACDAGAIRTATNALRAALGRGGVRPLDLQVATACEPAFNEAVRRCGNKADASFEMVARLMRRVWQGASRGAPRVVVDRQGGRTRYAEALRRVDPDALVRTLEESSERSVYELGEGGGGGRRMIVRFEVEADRGWLPVALASMAAKLVRELAMDRFNRHWGGVLPEVKPTAGYGSDARRWIEQASPRLTPEQRRRLVRIV